MEERPNLKYVRDRLETYIEADLELAPDYVFKMLENNVTENFLPAKKTVRADRNVWRVKVSGEKSLDIVFKALPIKYAGVSVILTGFVNAFIEADELMLPLGGILTDPKYIFVNISDYKTRFIYIPGEDKDIKSRMEGLFEYLLNRVDYDDMRAVNLLYDCYTLSMKDGQGVEAIIKRLDSEKDKLCEDEEGADESDFENVSKSGYEEKKGAENGRENRYEEENGFVRRSKLVRAAEKKSDAENKKVRKDEYCSEKNDDMLVRFSDLSDDYDFDLKEDIKPDVETKIKEWFFGRFNASKKKQDLKKHSGVGEKEKNKETQYCDFYETGENKEIQYRESHQNDTHTKMKADAVLYDMSGFEQDSSETVLLYNRACGKTPSLTDKNKNTVKIIKTPFLIGSLMYHTDFTIKDMTVSRLHAEIDSDEKGIMITDLNSTNGTYLNGELLVPKEKYLLNEGDTVVFGQVSYVFGVGT